MQTKLKTSREAITVTSLVHCERNAAWISHRNSQRAHSTKQKS